MFFTFGSLSKKSSLFSLLLNGQKTFTLSTVNWIMSKRKSRFSSDYNSYKRQRIDMASNCQPHTSTQESNSISNQIEEVYGNLFDCPVTHSMAHCISADVKMGKGIAVMFKKRFGGVDELWSQRQSPGGLAILKRDQRYIYNLITKSKYWDKPDYDTLYSSLEKMRDHNIYYGVKNLCMPRIGCGLDQLKWHRVLDIIREIYQGSDVQITVYNYDKDSNRGKGKGKQNHNSHSGYNDYEDEPSHQNKSTNKPKTGSQTQSSVKDVGRSQQASRAGAQNPQDWPALPGGKAKQENEQQRRKENNREKTNSCTTPVKINRDHESRKDRHRHKGRSDGEQQDDSRDRKKDGTPKVHEKGKHDKIRGEQRDGYQNEWKNKERNYKGHGEQEDDSQDRKSDESQNEWHMVGRRGKGHREQRDDGQDRKGDDSQDRKRDGSQDRKGDDSQDRKRDDSQDRKRDDSQNEWREVGRRDKGQREERDDSQDRKRDDSQDRKRDDSQNKLHEDGRQDKDHREKQNGGQEKSGENKRKNRDKSEKPPKKDDGVAQEKSKSQGEVAQDVHKKKTDVKDHSQKENQGKKKQKVDLSQEVRQKNTNIEDNSQEDSKNREGQNESPSESSDRETSSSTTDSITYDSFHNFLGKLENDEEDKLVQGQSEQKKKSKNKKKKSKNKSH